MVTRTYRLLGSWLLVAATFGCGTPSSGKPSQPDTETLADVAATDVIAVADDTDTVVFPDIAPDLPPADTTETGDMEEDAKVYTYVPADPCAEEPAAPAEGSTCTTVDELRCSDFQQQSKLTVDLKVAGGTDMIQTCQRLYVLRCEATASEMRWIRHFAGDLAGTEVDKAAGNAQGVWCLQGAAGPALEPGTCLGKYTYPACPSSAWGRRSCAGNAVVACGTASLIDAMLPDPLQIGQISAKDQLEDNFESCKGFGRRYTPEICSHKRLACKFKDPNTGQVTYPSVPGNCILDDDTGAHCATTCEEIGMEGPPK